MSGLDAPQQGADFIIGISRRFARLQHDRPRHAGRRDLVNGREDIIRAHPIAGGNRILCPQAAIEAFIGAVVGKLQDGAHRHGLSAILAAHRIRPGIQPGQLLARCQQQWQQISHARIFSTLWKHIFHSVENYHTHPATESFGRDAAPDRRPGFIPAGKIRRQKCARVRCREAPIAHTFRFPPGSAVPTLCRRGD